METDLGTIYKLNINMVLPDGLTMDDVDFSCKFYCWKDSIEIVKDDMIRIDGNNYVATVDSSVIGKGEIIGQYTIHIPDHDILNGIRTEIYTQRTGVKIC